MCHKHSESEFGVVDSHVYVSQQDQSRRQELALVIPCIG